MLTQDAKRLGIHPSQNKIEVRENPEYENDGKPEIEQLEDEPIDIVDNEDEPTVEADLEDLTMKELRKIADEKDIKVKFGTKKAELIELIKNS